MINVPLDAFGVGAITLQGLRAIAVLRLIEGSHHSDLDLDNLYLEGDDAILVLGFQLAWLRECLISRRYQLGFRRAEKASDDTDRIGYAEAVYQMTGVYPVFSLYSPADKFLTGAVIKVGLDHFWRYGAVRIVTRTLLHTAMLMMEADEEIPLWDGNVSKLEEPKLREGLENTRFGMTGLEW